MSIMSTSHKADLRKLCEYLQYQVYGKKYIAEELDNWGIRHFRKEATKVHNAGLRKHIKTIVGVPWRRIIEDSQRFTLPMTVDEKVDLLLTTEGK